MATLRSRLRSTKPSEDAPRTRSATRTRERILKAASTEFADNGFAGGRLERICAQAGVNIRMVYHYFGDKEGLYIAVLERELSGLRREELKLDVDHVPPLDGLLSLFDFTFNHFESHPRLIALLSGENLYKARFLKRSKLTPIVSSPVLSLIERLLARGKVDGSVRTGLDPLQLYVIMVGLSYFHLSNGHTLSVIFKHDVFDADWLEEHKRISREFLRTFLAPLPPRLPNA